MFPHPETFEWHQIPLMNTSNDVSGYFLRVLGTGGETGQIDIEHIEPSEGHVDDG